MQIPNKTFNRITICAILVIILVICLNNDLYSILKFIDLKDICISVLLVILQVIIAIIPAEPIEVAIGAKYGIWIGAIISLVGTTIATVLIFLMTKKHGTRILTKLLGKERLCFWQNTLDDSRFTVLTIIVFLIPWAPKDLFTYFAGARKTKLSKFLFTSLLARIPSLIISNSIGDNIMGGNIIFGILLSSLMLIVAFFVFRSREKFLQLFSKKVKIKKILLSESASLTSRETLTALKNNNYEIDILSSSQLSLCHFTNIRHNIIQIDNPNDNPKKYLSRISDIIEKNQYDAIIPTHEQAWLFAAGRKLLPHDALLAIADITAFDVVQSKIQFAKLLNKLNILQPKWEIFSKDSNVHIPFPYWCKAEFGTAGRSVVRINSKIDEENNLLNHNDADLLIQENIDGIYGQVQAIFDKGTMIVSHVSLQTSRGAGGSAASRISYNLDSARESIKKIGIYINWHGALTVDFIYSNHKAYFIECNPRMIEPGNAVTCNINLPQILISISTNDLTGVIENKFINGIRSHSAIAILLGIAEKTKRRKDILKTAAEIIRKKVHSTTPQKP